MKILSLEKQRAGSITIELSPEEYSYEVLNKTLAKESEGSWFKQNSFTVAWKYILYVLAMKKVVDRDQGYVKRNAAHVFAYVRGKLSAKNLNFIDLLISYLKRLEGVKLGKFEAGLKVKEIQKLYQLEEINDLLDEFRVLTGKYPVSIFIDELDRGWDKSEDAQAFVSGLFQAALKINQEHRDFKVIVSLRKEIYENIPALYDDAQKVWDQFEIIEWDEDSLLELIAKRIAYSLKLPPGVSQEQVWNSVFSEVLDYRGTKSINYVIDRTSYRPREVIQFCTEVKNNLKPGSQIPINYDTVSIAEVQYSGNRIRDIASEYKFQYPGLESVFETFRGLNYTFERVALESHCERIILGDVKVDKKAADWVANLDSGKLVAILWEVGFLKAQAVGGIRGKQRSGSKYLGSYQISSLDLSPTQYFQVHPMVRVSLGLKEKREA